ncbi:MAG: HD domain-containing protein [Myxococcales bacterium]|jgi:3'-5' exoribonuclease|nr:HD domain-containing protein [Myxococcales bacterium]
MKKTFVKDIHDKDSVNSIFLVTRKTLVTNKAKPFLALMLRDRTGDLDARAWEDAERLAALFERDDYIRVEGTVLQYQGRLQLKVDAIEKASAEGLDPADFAGPIKAAPGDRAIAQIQDMAERIQDPNLKALAQAFLGDEAIVEPLRRAPAARSIHHSAPGGLAEHTLSVMRLVQRIADHYPMADRDLMLCGALLHDIGKLREMSMERQTEYTDEGRLLGHLAIGAQMIHDRCAKLPDFPQTLETHLLHIVLAHHGALEFGSPRLPQTLEAILVHHLDDLDSKVGALMEIYQRDPYENEAWTDFQKVHNRHFFKGPTPTVHAKLPFERKKRRAAAAQNQKEKQGKVAEQSAPARMTESSAPLTESKAALGTHGQPPPAPERKAPEKAAGDPNAEPRREKRERDADRDRDRKGGPKVPAANALSFKPFAALAAALGERDPQEALDVVRSAVDAVAQTVEAAVDSAVKVLSADKPTADETTAAESVEAIDTTENIERPESSAQSAGEAPTDRQDDSAT